MRRTILAVAVLAAVSAVPAAAQDDAAGAQAVAAAHQADFQMGQLATIRGQSARVRQFGQSLMDDHGTAIERLAADGRLTWPIEIDPKHRQLEQELSTLDGRAFDRRFASAMVEDHEALAALLRGQGDAPRSAARQPRADGAVGTSGTMSASRAPAGSALRSVERHLAEAKRLQRSLGGH